VRRSPTEAETGGSIVSADRQRTIVDGRRGGGALISAGGYPADGRRSPRRRLDVLPAIGYGTSLPASPNDTDEYILVDSLTLPTYAWRFRYSTAVTDAYKWVFIGGSPIYAIVATPQSTTSGGLIDLATVGPTITLPRAGIYEARFGAQIQAAIDNGGANQSGYCGLSNNGAAGVTQAYVSATGNAGQGYATAQFEGRYTMAGANQTLKLQYGRNQNGVGTNGNFQNRYLAAVPVRVS
jgi:hypothetical protein